MAASKLRFSACTHDGNVIPTVMPIFSGSNYQQRIVVMLCGQTGSGKFKIAATKMELLLSQLVDLIRMQLQWLNLCFRGSAIQRS